MRRIVEPAISDLQIEHATAIARGRGFAAFVYARGVVGCLAAVAGGWRLSDDRVLSRLVGWTIVATTVLTSLLIGLPYRVVAWRIPPGRSWAVLVSLVPQALAVMLPAAMPCAAAIVLRSTSPDARVRRSVFAVAIVCAAATLLNVATITPFANQTFRVLMAGHFVVRGVNELTLAELWRKHAWLQLNGRAALACAPLVLTAFVWRTLAWRRSAFGSALAISGIVVYNLAYLALPSLWPPFMPGMAVAWSVWLPNLVFATATVLLAGWNRIGYHPPCSRSSSHS
jgi:hypothetical protein